MSNFSHRYHKIHGVLQMRPNM